MTEPLTASREAELRRMANDDDWSPAQHEDLADLFAEIDRLRGSIRNSGKHEPPDPRDESQWPIAIDPPSCACNECIIGQYVPLDQASADQIVDMLLGRIGNNLSSWEKEHTQLQVTVVIGGQLRDLPPEQSARLLKRRVADVES